MNCCLTIAGSDSGGNAGVQADLRAFHAYGLHGCTVIAALTAQNPFGVSAIHPVPAEFVDAQLRAVLGTYSIAALKTGMLASREVIEVVSSHFSTHTEIAKVVDPVLIATSGARLVEGEAIDAIRSRLLPQATLITPNLPEAEVLAGCPGAAEEQARRIYEKFGAVVLVKGGHARQADAVDVLCYGSCGRTIVREFRLPWVTNPVSTHGTGCTLAAALAAELALGRDLESAVMGAKSFVRRAINDSYPVGKNCGVLGFVHQDLNKEI